MSPAMHRDPTPSSPNNKILDQHGGRVEKSKKPSIPTLKLKNGLLKTEMSDRSELMQITKRNSVESPLLRLPPELRNWIWEYILGHHVIWIAYSSWNYRFWVVPNNICERIKHPFALPRVCRQTQVEASAMVYTLNWFDFYNIATFDHFFRNLVQGRCCLITSITVPTDYFQLYLRGLRKPFRAKFTNIECIRVKYIAVGLWRVVYSLPITYHSYEIEENRLKRVVEDRVRQKEGEDLEIEWYY